MYKNTINNYYYINNASTDETGINNTSKLSTL